MNDNVQCVNCGQNTGYYERLGSEYRFFCRNCGIEINPRGAVEAMGMLELIFCDGSKRYLIFRRPITGDEAKKLLSPNRHLYVSATLRMVNQEGITSLTIIKKTPVRQIAARIVLCYLWIEATVLNVLKWNIYEPEKDTGN